MRTWDDNRRAINQLWPMCEWTEEERKLFTEDLSGLDQAVLYDAIRNVKRSNETLYPHLKQFRDEYRRLFHLKKLTDRKLKVAEEPKQTVHIDSDSNERCRLELREYIESVSPSDYEHTRDLIADRAARLEIQLETAFGLGRYLVERLGMASGGVVS